MKILYFDCFSGISGDMTLGALLDLGIDRKHWREEMKKLKLTGYRLEIKEGIKKGISGTDVFVELEQAVQADSAHRHVQDDQDSHNHEHSHHHAGQRNFREIRQLIEDSEVSRKAKELALVIFEKLARAEGKIHGISYEEVHFHEVGAVDSIVDIVGVAICLDLLSPDKIISSPVNVGGGMVKCQHGLYPVPAPATLELLKGIPVYTSGHQFELVTPTGAAILAALGSEFTAMPEMVIREIGYGIGKRDYELPNCLRVWQGESVKKKPAAAEVKILESNIDDMSGEIFGFLIERLLQEKALDVWYTPVYMKKNRPGVQISVLCEVENEDRLRQVLLKETTTLGVRSYSATRQILARKLVTVETPFGPIAMKTAVNGVVRKGAPEYEDCKRAALQHQVPLREVYQAALKAYLD